MKKVRLTPLLIGALSTALFAAACGDDDDKGKGSDDDKDSGGDDAGSGGKGSGGKGSGGKGSGGKGSGGKGTGGVGTGGKGSGGSGAGGAGAGGAEPDGGPDGGTTLSLCDGKAGAELVTCGKYIVEHVTACADCHSPIGPTGPDMTRALAGNPSFTDIDPDPGKGNVPAPNLTQLKNQGWTSDQIVTAIRDGKDKAGNGLFPAMPYITFHNMALIDAQAIAAYILSLTPITNAVPQRQPLPAPFDDAQALPVPVFPLSDVPDPVGVPAADQDAAMLGKYLAGQLGPCIECHTPRNQFGAVDSSRAFAGGAEFPSADLGLPSPPFPAIIYSLNLTPDTTGIAGWTAADVAKVLHDGVDKAGNPLCPPMPFGPMGAFGGLTDEHATAIGTYLTHLAPIENTLGDAGAFPFCVMPGPPPGDGGVPDASSPEGGQTDGG